MPASPQHLLEIAKHLRTLSNEPAHRSSLSRAYYASFHACKQWLSQQPGVPSACGPEGGVHQHLINQLRNPAPEVHCESTRQFSRALSSQLNALKVRRVTADYKLHASEPFEDWSANAIATTELMLSQMNICSSAPSLAPAAISNRLEAESNQSLTPPSPPIGRPTLKRVK